MTQGDVLKLLKNSKRGMTAKQIAKRLKISRGNANANCNKLLKSGDIFIARYIQGGYGNKLLLYKIKNG